MNILGKVHCGRFCNVRYRPSGQLRKTEPVAALTAYLHCLTELSCLFNPPQKYQTTGTELEMTLCFCCRTLCLCVCTQVMIMSQTGYILTQRERKKAREINKKWRVLAQKRASSPNSQYPHQSSAADVISVGHTRAGQTTQAL